MGPGENAGVIDIGDGYKVVMKIESHNHPSAVEPYQGAATGVGGILRDIFTMGARPIAALNSLRFGNLQDDRVRYLFKNVVKDPKKFAIYKAWADQMDFQRPLAVPPGTPPEQLAILRKALADVLKDKELLQEAKKSKLVITSVSGERTAKLVDEILSMSTEAKKSLAFLVRKKSS